MGLKRLLKKGKKLVKKSVKLSKDIYTLKVVDRPLKKLTKKATGREIGLLQVGTALIGAGAVQGALQGLGGASPSGLPSYDPGGSGIGEGFGGFGGYSPEGAATDQAAAEPPLAAGLPTPVLLGGAAVLALLLLKKK